MGKPKRIKKPKRKPLTHRAHAMLKAHGSMTSDALARRLRVKSKVASHAASGLKRIGKASSRESRGETFWSARGKWPI